MYADIEFYRKWVYVISFDLCIVSQGIFLKRTEKIGIFCCDRIVKSNGHVWCCLFSAVFMAAISPLPQSAVKVEYTGI